jgi:hypothetical protein
MADDTADDAPETPTEAAARLRREGYDAEMDLRDGRLWCSSCGAAHDPADALIVRTYRFEGTSDPGDEMLVAGLRCPSCDHLAVLETAYGGAADPALARLPGRGTTA